MCLSSGALFFEVKHPENKGVARNRQIRTGRIWSDMFDYTVRIGLFDRERIFLFSRYSIIVFSHSPHE